MRYLLVFLSVLSVLAAGCGKNESSAPTPAGEAAADSAARMDLVLARIGDIEITGANVREHMLKRSGAEQVEKYIKNPDILQVALAGLVDQYVWSEYAKKQGMKLDPVDRRKVMNLESQLMASKYVSQVVEKKAKPTREMVEEYYNEHPNDYLEPVVVAVRHILVGTRAKAEAVKKELEAGGDFTTLAANYSQDEATKNQGGALGYLQKGKAVLPIGKDKGFEQAVLAMDVGDIKIVETSMGFHVVKVEEKKGGDVKPLSEAYDLIEQLLTPRRIGEVYNQELVKAREDVGVKYITENFNKFSGVEDNTKRLLELAKTANETQSKGKAEILRRLAYDFPDAREAPEALFRLAYLQLVVNKNRDLARSTLQRLLDKYKYSQWRKAASFVLENLEMNPEDFGTPEEILAQTSK